jgi:hypothetical protein
MTNGNPTVPTLTFGDHVSAPLDAGEHTVTVTQKVTIGQPVEGYTASRRFSVAGARFGLAPGTISACFPPAGSQGDFANVLAHVVLSQPSLPWQRSPSTTRIPSGQALPSWLAILVFDAADPPPEPQTVTLAQLASAGSVFVPERPPGPEALTDPVTVIDVPIELFTAIAPALADLPWIAHVRRAEVARKATDGDTAVPTDYAVVLANRLPAPATLSTAHLVSLEWFGSYLPGSSGANPFPAGCSAVRLVTLASWTFGTESLAETFQGALLDATDAGPLQRRPVPVQGGAPAAEQAVAAALGMGYTALNHGLRNGEATVSWYRGPLLPLAGAPTTAPPYRDADQLLRFDPTTGMLDVSYSAAWTLGRLLALRDSAFATALYRWKLTQTQRAINLLEQQLLDDALADAAAQAGLDEAEPRASRAAKSLVGGALDAMAKRAEAMSKHAEAT